MPLLNLGFKGIHFDVARRPTDGGLKLKSFLERLELVGSGQKQQRAAGVDEVEQQQHQPVIVESDLRDSHFVDFEYVFEPMNKAFSKSV